jgi:hypothetical protein
VIGSRAPGWAHILRSFIRDARSIRAALLARALYEVLKGVGLVRVATVIVSKLPKGAPQVHAHVAGWEVSACGKGRRTAGASREPPASSTVEFFDTRIRWASAPHWHVTVVTPHRWPVVHWTRVDIRSSERLADVKWTWELGRHAHLVVLARAAALGDESAVDLLEAQLRSWLDQNPPEVGVHWYSNLEIALRAVAWAQILALAGDRLDSGLRREMAATLRHAGRHLLVELPYTVSSMRNNHLLGDALGMVTIGEMFRSTREGRFLRRLGDRIFRAQLGRQVHDDGSMLEDSISYHRFSLEMLAVRALLPGTTDDVKVALARAGQFMFRLGVGDGVVPQYGDWDEGRVLAVAENRCDLLGSARLALALAGSGAPPEWRDRHEEVTWYAPAGQPLPPQPAEVDGHDIGGGMARAARGELTAWLKAGRQPSHGHADLCSTPIRLGDQWLVCDPGTGTYNGPIEQRNYFRCSIAHNVLRVEGLDQLEPHRAVRWRHTATGVVGPPLAVGERVLMGGAHDAYRRLVPARRVARAVLVGADLVVVADWVEGPSTSYALSFPLTPEVEWSDGSLVLPDGSHVGLDLPAPPTRHRGEQAPYDGWWSRTYGHAEPATRLEVRGTTDGPVTWTVRAHSTAPVASRGDRLTVGDDSFEVLWSPGGAALRHVDRSGVEQTAFLSLA